MIGIVAIIYQEEYWKETELLLAQTTDPVYLVDRKGVGSMSEAYNTGFKEAMNDANYEWIWFVSNITFKPKDWQNLKNLSKTMTGYAAINPVYNSDHAHLRPGYSNYSVYDVPFVEFTAPLVRASVFQDNPLDEMLPYWGQDLDWSYRVRQNGWKLAACSEMELGHDYIRDSAPNKITEQRKKLRMQTPFGQTAAGSNQPYSTRSPKPSSQLTQLVKNCL
jgi:hypothetical protein